MELNGIMRLETTATLRPAVAGMGCNPRMLSLSA